MKALVIKGKTIGEGRPLMCVPVMESTREKIVDEIAYLSKSEADMIEWRLDVFEAFDDSDAVLDILKTVAPMLKEKIFLCTFRSKQQGGTAEMDADSLRKLQDAMSKSGHVDLIDLEFFGEENPTEQIRQLQAQGVHVITSHHDFAETPSFETMEMILAQMCKCKADIVKLAVMPQTVSDVLQLLAVTAQFHETNPDTPVISMSMGKLGNVSRLCGETFGSCVTFGAHEKPSAPGQYEMKQLFGILEAIHESNER